MDQFDFHIKMKMGKKTPNNNISKMYIFIRVTFRWQFHKRDVVEIIHAS